jgi:hypothetical protein
VRAAVDPRAARQSGGADSPNQIHRTLETGPGPVVLIKREIRGPWVTLADYCRVRSAFVVTETGQLKLTCGGPPSTDYPLAKLTGFFLACLALIEVPLLVLWAGTISEVHGPSAVWHQTTAFGAGLLYGAGLGCADRADRTCTFLHERPPRVLYLRRSHSAVRHLGTGSRA